MNQLPEIGFLRLPQIIGNAKRGIKLSAPKLSKDFRLAIDLAFRKGCESVLFDNTPVVAETDPKVNGLLAAVRGTYKKFDATQLLRMTCEEGTLWDQVSKSHNGNISQGTDIPENTILSWFKNHSESNAAHAATT